MSHHCPSCERVLYSRRLKRCGFCDAPIPEELRFSPEEIAELDRKIAELEENFVQRARAAEAACEAAKAQALMYSIICSGGG